MGKFIIAPSLKLHAMLKKKAMENRLMVYPMGGTIDGINGDHILLASPLFVDENIVDGYHVVQITERLANVLQSSVKLTHKKYQKQGGRV